ncbi:ATP-dependent DNA helicase [Microbacterium sp.]|uniref:ATP-dependent DNA helicase n=1 Tax=Microbacterium sp. TaxID=51671 RepID=UPI0028114CCF|nr:ATP-dependent DNA helicase [Microbacterium sp.]
MTIAPEQDVEAVAAWGPGHGLRATHISAALGLPTPTPAQQRVIEAPPLPALVVAGAGSGKTETMSGRVVWLVANGHVERDQILGLTFTRKAAGELDERISARLALVDEFGRRGLLPHLAGIVERGELADVDRAATPAQRTAVRRRVLDDLAERYGTGWDPSSVAGVDALMIRPRVSTYNAFADAIVREHAARIGRDPEAAMLSTSASWLIARHVVLRAQLPGLEEVERSVTGVVDAVQRLAGDVLDHRVDLDELERLARREAARFEPYIAHDKARKPYTNLVTLPILAQLVRDYIDEKQRRGVLDFADQVDGAFRIVETAPNVRDDLRQQYRVVLLDEYQDTSVIQTRFLAEVFRDGAVMAVGDPHQSIYGWRGASADNLYAFGDAFADDGRAAQYDLMTSWRNDRAILSVANRVLQPLQGDRGITVPALEPRPGAGEGHVEVAFTHTVDEEADAVADWFARLRAAHTAGNPHSAESAAKPHTGAILFRSKRHMSLFAAKLAERGVPHRILGLGGLLSTPEVVDVLSVLRVLHDPTSGSPLIRLLVGPRFRVGVADMAALYDLAAELARRDAALSPLPAELAARLRTSNGADEAVSIVDAVDVVRTMRDDYRLLQGITPEGRTRIREAAAMLERLRRQVGQPIPELIRLIEIELRLDIELAANETRGSARVASTQLRAFVDEVRGFLSADERGTIGSLLAWLDRAEQADELMPRTEPPEPGVVQLLTIHGSKGLEWDAVAVVRLVEGELPGSVKDTAGWLGFGVLPYALRGDRAALPRFEWDPLLAGLGIEEETKRRKAELDSLVSESQDPAKRGALARFADGNRRSQREEERRLAYVAVTRARTDLLLSGAHWAGQSRPRVPSEFLVEIMGGLGLDPIGPVDKDDNPYTGTAATREWPMEPLGRRRDRVTEAAALVRAAAPVEPSPRLARLLAERAERERGRALTAPTRIPASRFKDYVADFAGTVSQISRPMPERPYTQTRIGTLFHQWVEQRSGIAGAGSSTDDALWESDEELWGEDIAPDTEVSAEDEVALARLRDIFLRSEWAPLRPIEVETEIDFAMPGADGEPDHIVICKLDAVYERNGRIEIVDWKTGKAPRTAAEKEQRMLQLALYRVAYHRRHGMPLDRIDVALFYVGDDLVIRDDRIYSEAELVQRWNAARAERRASSASG